MSYSTGCGISAHSQIRGLLRSWLMAEFRGRVAVVPVEVAETLHRMLRRISYSLPVAEFNHMVGDTVASTYPRVDDPMDE